MPHLIDVQAYCPIEAAEVLRHGRQPRQHNAYIATTTVKAPKPQGSSGAMVISLIMPCNSAREVTGVLCVCGVIGHDADWPKYYGRTRDAISVTIASVAEATIKHNAVQSSMEAILLQRPTTPGMSLLATTVCFDYCRRLINVQLPRG
jgi:hypothetical protein